MEKKELELTFFAQKILKACKFSFPLILVHSLLIPCKQLNQIFILKSQ
jgi:hypothetical protein